MANLSSDDLDAPSDQGGRRSLRKALLPTILLGVALITVLALVGDAHDLELPAPEGDPVSESSRASAESPLRKMRSISTPPRSG